MNFTPVACVVCQCEVNASAISPCIKGHHQCQICSIRLNGFCGVCTTPIELQTSSLEADAFVRVIPDTEYVSTDVQDFWDPQQLPLNNSNKYYENIVVIEDTDIQEPATNYVENPIFYNSNNLIKSSEFVSPSLMEILKSLHETKCSRNCKTFDYCIRQILWQQFHDNEESYCLEASNLNNISISDMLQNIHKNSCNQQCDNIVYCLSSTLKHLISTQTINAKEIQKDSYETVESISHKSVKSENIEQSESRHSDCAALVDKESNVVRAHYRNNRDWDKKSEHLEPQFEVVTTFLSLGSKSQKDFSLPFSFELNSATAKIKCPLLECNNIVEDRVLCKHFLEKHKQLELLQLEPNKHKLFFIDPSIIECNEISCIASYMIPNVFISSKEMQLENPNLPILVMAYRTKLNSTETSDKFSVPKKYMELDEEIMDAEVAETVYGTKKKHKSEPVIWANNDILIICPIAPIPEQKALRTNITIFSPQKPNANFSTSFCMRSARDFIAIGDLLGSPDSICLTSVDIATFTSNGEHAIHCQIMCKV